MDVISQNDIPPAELVLIEVVQFLGDVKDDTNTQYQQDREHEGAQELADNI